MPTCGYLCQVWTRTLLHPAIIYSMGSHKPRVLENGRIEMRCLFGLVVEPQTWHDLLHIPLLDYWYLLTGWTTVGQAAPSDRGSPETDFVHAVSRYP